MVTLDSIKAQVRGLVTSASQRGGNINAVPVVDQITSVTAPYLPGVANYAASQLPRPGQTNVNIPPMASFVMTKRIPVGGGKTPASLGTLGTGRVQAIGALTRPAGK